MATNHNVRVIYAFTFMRSTWISLFSNTPLSYYVFLVTGSNTKVGLIQGIQGVINLATSFPAAMLGDSAGRQMMLQIATVIGVIAMAATLLTLLVVEKACGTGHKSPLFLALLGCMSLWGLFMGIHSATLEAVFGDSVESGKRSEIYSRKAAMNTAGNAVGPALSLIVFAVLGDDWSIRNLTVLMAGPGMVAAAVVLALLLQVREQSTLPGRLSESLLLQESLDVPDQRQSDVRGESAKYAKEDPFEHSASGNEDADTSDEGEVMASSRQQTQTRNLGKSSSCGCGVRPQNIAGLVAISDFVSALGSGMTVKFFPLWFGEELNISPMGVLGIMLAAPVGITAFNVGVGRLAKFTGRVQAVLLCKAIGISLLVTLSLTASVVEAGNQLPAGKVVLLVSIYLVRTWLMNCTSGLTKSVLNDFVSKKHRAKWNSLESVNMFSWSGSAALGGWLVDTYGYRATFLITATLQTTAALILSPLLTLVPVETFDSVPYSEPAAEGVLDSEPVRETNRI